MQDPLLTSEKQMTNPDVVLHADLVTDRSEWTTRGSMKLFNAVSVVIDYLVNCDVHRTPSAVHDHVFFSCQQ